MAGRGGRWFPPKGIEIDILVDTLGAGSGDIDVAVTNDMSGQPHGRGRRAGSGVDGLRARSASLRRRLQGE